MRQLDIRSQGFKAAPHSVLAEAMRDGPFAMVKVPLLGAVRTALTHDAVHQVLKDTDRFAVNARNAGHKRPFGLFFIPGSLKLLSENLLAHDDPDHMRLRRLADAPFRRASIETGRDQVTALVESYLDEIEVSESRDVDLVDSVFKSLPVTVISQMLGLTEDAQHRLLRTMSGFSGATSTWGLVRAIAGLGGVIRQIREEIERARRDPRPGLLNDLIHAEAEGGKMSENELVSLILVLFVAGHETTTNLLSSGLYTLHTEPGAWETARSLDADGWRVAVDELMRFAMPIHMTKPRFVIADTEIAGHAFKRGEKVMALLGAANIDPNVFDDPLKLDLARRPNRHTGWGGGPHICLGLHLAKMETELALSRLAARWPDMTLGTPLTWSKRVGTRGFDALPVRLKP